MLWKWAQAVAALVVVGVVYLPNESWARPEYAAKHGVVSCTACHISPTGGGIRNKYGKLYGSGAFKSSPFSLNEKFQGDVRAIYYASDNVEDASARSGFNLMAVTGAVNVPIRKSKEEANFNLVATYNFGNFATEVGLRDTYMLWSRGHNKFIEDVLVGQFILPFGLLTDEHRTYVRIQTNTTWNHYYGGALVAGEVFEGLHYDWAFLNSYKDPTTASFNSGLQSGTALNLRWGNPGLPGYIGASVSYFSLPEQRDLRAYSGYGVLSLDRLTDGFFNGAVLVEHVVTENWNQDKLGLISDASRIVTDTAFKTGVQDQQSLGWYTQVNLDFTRKWTVTFKYDYLAFAKDFTGDAFHRRGVGIKHFANSNLNIVARAEWAEAGSDQIDPATTPGAMPAYWLVMHAWF